MGLLSRRTAANDDISRLLHTPHSPLAKYAPAVRDSRGHFHDPDYRPFSPPPPHWHALYTAPLAGDNNNDDDDDDDDDDRRLSDGYAYSSVWAHRRVSHHRRDTSYYSYYSPSPLPDYSPPTSYSSAATVLSHDPSPEKSWTGVLKRRRRDKCDQQTCDEDPVSFFPTPTPPQPKQEEYVPTCGEVFQRRWQTLCLAFNLSIFRAQRRVKHCVHSFMASH